MADRKCQVFALQRSEALRLHRKGINTRRKIGEAVTASGICHCFLKADERGPSGNHLSMRNHGVRRILNRALYAARCLLAKCTLLGNQYQSQGKRQGYT